MCIARFINHGVGKEVNVCLCGVTHTNIVEIVPTRPILEGEELRTGYGAKFKYDWPCPGDDTFGGIRVTRPQHTSTIPPTDRAAQDWITTYGLTSIVTQQEATTGFIAETLYKPPDVRWACKGKFPKAGAQSNRDPVLDDHDSEDALDIASKQMRNEHTDQMIGATRVDERVKRVHRYDGCIDGHTKQIPVHGLRASDGLVFEDGDYKSNWSKWDLENGPYGGQYPELTSFLEDSGLEHNAMSRDTKESPRILPDQTNEAPWIQAAAKAKWAWNSNIVPIGFIENEGEFAHQQIFLDTVAKPLEIYHWRTRSGRAGVNRRIMGSFVITEKNQKGNIIHRGHPPLLQIDHKFGVRLAGNVIKGQWDGPHKFSWRNISSQWVRPEMSNGELELNPEGEGGTGFVWSGSEKDPVIRWRLDRNRVVAGPGGMPTYSPKRKLAALPGAGKLLAFPTGNREDYILAQPRPKRPKTRLRAVFKDWNEVFRENRYEKITKWLKRQAAHLHACEHYCKIHGVKFIPDADYAKIAKMHRLPPILIMNDSDLVDKCKGMRMMRKSDGSIIQMFDDDPPIMPGAVKPEMVEREERVNTPWSNKRMFQDLHEGFLAPLAHEKGNTIVLRAYSKTLYQCAGIWKEEREKGSDPDSMCHMFSEETPHLAACPMVISNRSHVAKENGKWRQILNMSLHVIEGFRRVAPSLNARLRAARELEPTMPNLEMTKGTDISTCVGIYEAFGCKVKVYTWDASQYFHNFGLGFLQSCEQGILGATGNAMSVVLDMGREDSPRLTAQTSSFTTEAVSKSAHSKIMEKVDLPPEALTMTKTRGEYYGHESRQARLATGFMFVDDLALVTIDHPQVDAIVKKLVPMKTKPMGLAFTEEKYSDDRKRSSVFIGQRYNVVSRKSRKQGKHSTQHIKKSKLLKYEESWNEVKVLSTMSNEIHDQLLGRLTYAATAYLELKPVAAIVNDCKYSTHRMTTPGLFPFSNTARAAMDFAVGILKKDEGLPVLPIFDIPKHDQVSTITLRGDASLNEENGYNGFGIWFLIPQTSGPPINLALFDEWSEEEQELLGRDTPMAEGLCLVLGLRFLAANPWLKPWHTSILQLTDSESCSMKFASLRAGSVRLDNARAAWQKLQEGNPNVLPAWVQHTHREMNTGSDLLSKARWALFQATLKAAGLGEARRVFLSKEDRNVKDLISALRTF